MQANRRITNHSAVCLDWEDGSLQEESPARRCPTGQGRSFFNNVTLLPGSIRINGWQVWTQQMHKLPWQSLGFTFNGGANMQRVALD